MTDDSPKTPQVKSDLTDRDAEILRLIMRNAEFGSLQGEIMRGLALSRAEERARCAAIARQWGYENRFTDQLGAPDRIAETIERGKPA